MTAELVRAAGGVVVRAGADGPEILVVHRPRYDDWSFPKGKQDPGETDEQTALREVAEETGFECRLGDPLPDVRYHDHRDRPKLVRYWVMHPAADVAFVANDEVDEVRWCSPADAAALLTYGHDRALVAAIPSDRAVGSRP